MSQKKANQYFTDNSDTEKVFSTSDGFLFTSEMYARDHAAVLSDKEVTKHLREVAPVILSSVVAEVPVTTVNEEGKDLRTFNQSVDLPTVTDSPLNIEGTVKVITDALDAKIEASKNVIAPDTDAKTAEKAKATPAK